MFSILSNQNRQFVEKRNCFLIKNQILNNFPFELLFFVVICIGKTKSAQNNSMLMIWSSRNGSWPNYWLDYIAYCHGSGSAAWMSPDSFVRAFICSLSWRLSGVGWPATVPLHSHPFFVSQPGLQQAPV